MKKLEIGKDYVNLHDNDVVIIDRVSDIINRGFEGREYKNYMSCSNTSNWREATEEEVIEAFERHLVRRYGEDWRTMKIKEMHPNATSDLDINDGAWCIKISKHSNGWNVWNNNGLLYRNGIWVERLEEKPKIHIKEAIKERTVIHCETIEEADRILKMAIKLGYMWNSRRSYKDAYQWGMNESKTCYHLLDGMYSDYDYFKKANFIIIPSTQIADLKPEELAGWSLAPEEIEEKSDKKRYEVIKTTFSDFKQISLGDNKTNKIIAHFVNQDEDTLLVAEKIADILNLLEK